LFILLFPLLCIRFIIWHAPGSPFFFLISWVPKVLLRTLLPMPISLCVFLKQFQSFRSYISSLIHFDLIFFL
jgi:hypothetical protein